MLSTYIVSTIEMAKKDSYKFGRHTGTLRKLESRYTTSLINPIVYFFLPHDNSKEIEEKIKKILIGCREINNNGTITEWYNIDLGSLTSIIISQANKFSQLKICEIKSPKPLDKITSPKPLDKIKSPKPLDKMELFVKEKFIKTNEDSDRIHKDDFLYEYQHHYNLKRVTWVTILKDIKRIGLEYDRSKRGDGKRGVIIGLVKKYNNENNDKDNIDKDDEDQIS